MITQMLVNFTLTFISAIALALAFYYTLTLRAKTEKVMPFWLFVSVAVLFMLLYAVSDLVEFGSYILLGEVELADNLAETMDWFEMAALAATASFLASAGLLLKRSNIRPI